MIKFTQLVTIALLSVTLYAHGGQYRGPGDVVPPGGGGLRRVAEDTGQR